MLDFLANSLHSIAAEHAIWCIIVIYMYIHTYIYIYVYMHFSVCVFVYKFHIWIDRA